MSSKEHRILSWIVALLGFILAAHIWIGILYGQEAPPPRHPTGRVGGPTLTPTETPTVTPTPTATSTPTVTPTGDPCSACPAPESIACAINYSFCLQCWIDCGQPIFTPTPTRPPTRTPTPTAAPGDCSHCPDPDGMVCAYNYPLCVQCWADCGQPIATPTPVPPTPTRTPGCWFVSQGGTVTLIAIYAHESTAPGVRYTYQTPPQTSPAGSIVEPGAYEGHPVGFEFYFNGALTMSCGDVRRGYPPSEDGFEPPTTNTGEDVPF
jgi:hypothetical protein